MAETPKRLKESKDTIRHLFAHSGNECAFEGCTRRLINHRGQVVGQICHIRGALPGGERFDPAMTNEERRSQENLLLLCYDHHVETNDVEDFPVERLLEIKRAHEGQFADRGLPMAEKDFDRATEALWRSEITDTTDRLVLRLPQTLEALGAQQGWGVSLEELAASLDGLPEILTSVRRLPVDTRRVFGLFIRRGRKKRDDHVGIPLFELAAALKPGVGPADLDGHIDVLRNHDLARRVFYDESDDGDRFRDIEYLVTCDPGWPFWDAFRDFCEGMGLDVVEVIDELRFDVLDTGSIGQAA